VQTVPDGVIFCTIILPMRDAPPSTINAMAFVDGQNLFRHAKEAFGHFHPNYDVQKLHQKVCAEKGWRPTLVNFYTGVPPQIESQEWAAYWSNRVLALKRAGVRVVTRPIRYRKTDVLDLDGMPLLNPDGTVKTVKTPQEKGIDVRIALDIVRLARKRQFDVALLFSQDQDLAELVEEIREISQEQDRWIKLACAFPVSGISTCETDLTA
jgi:uncharacterized LabA/DUF88 family protein